MKSPNVSRATKELEEAGIIARRRRYHSGGNVGIQYTFNGLALAKATVEQEHPTLQGAIINVITAESDGSAEGTPAQIQKAGRDYHIDNGAIITLIPEPEDRTGRGTLIDNHQSTSGSSDLTNDLLGDSDARAKTLPAWFQELARKVDSNILPNFRQVDEARKLAGWSEAAMRQAVQKYVQVYRGKTVNAPETLFRKLAIEAARKAPASTSGDELPKVRS